MEVFDEPNICVNTVKKNYFSRLKCSLTIKKLHLKTYQIALNMNCVSPLTDTD